MLNFMLEINKRFVFSTKKFKNSKNERMKIFIKKRTMFPKFNATE